MKKRGFTLAEVLITLGIVGVVAALTAPALVMSSRNEANAARLSVVVSNLENAFQSAIAQEGADNLYGTSLWDFGGGERLNATEGNKAQFVGRLGQYMIVNGYKNSEADFYGSLPTCPMTNSGGTNSQACISNGGQRFAGDGRMFTIETKTGAAIHIRAYRRAGVAQAKAAAILRGNTYYTNAADIIIDVNGKNAPNTFGRDIFWFELGENGVLYPLGGEDVSNSGSWQDENGNQVRHGTWDTADNQASCRDDNKGNVAGTRGIGCAARVIADGYKINY